MYSVGVDLLPLSAHRLILLKSTIALLPRTLGKYHDDWVDLSICT
jgi:hypothetical protein